MAWLLRFAGHRGHRHHMPRGRTRLKEHDPSIEPIIVLGCGHAYTLSTLDGFMDLESVYLKVCVLHR